MRQIFLCLLLLFGTGLYGQAQTAPTKQDDIRQLMDLMGTTTLMKQTMSTLVGQYQQLNTNLPKNFWEEIQKEADYNSLITQLIPLYDKHYSHDDIKGLLAFYKSPVGQKLIQELPALMQESSAIGRAWGEKLGQQIAERIQNAQAAPKN